MTVSTTENKAIHTADGILVTYPYTYRMDNDGDMEVYLDEVLQPSGYVVNRNPDNIGGTVTFDVAPASGVLITLLREIALTQETDYVAGDPFPAESHEDALDKLTMITQDLQEQVSRNAQAIGGEDGVDTTAPPFTANKAWKWDDGTEKKIINSTYDPDEQVTLATEQANLATSSANQAELDAWNAEAEALTAESYAEEPENINVNEYTSNGDGTFTATPTVYFSAHHWAIKAGDNAAGVNSVNGRAGDVILDSSDVGLANVDNTSDLNKPISTDTQAALDLKADSATTPTISYVDQQAIVFAIALG